MSRSWRASRALARRNAGEYDHPTRERALSTNNQLTCAIRGQHDPDKTSAVGQLAKDDFVARASESWRS
jgi:hypothetical protein